MKKYLALAITLLASAVLSAADVLPVFNATLTAGKQSRFVLIGADGKASSWLQIGDTFDGYTLKDFDGHANALDLEKDGKVSRVTLASDAKVADGALAATPATLADAEAVLNKLHFDELLSRGLDRQRKMINAQFEQLANRMAAQGVDPKDAADFRKKLLDLAQSIIDPNQLKTDMTKIYSDVFTKQELDSMAAFFSTPTGEQIAQKQGDVQDKLGGLIQQRMMTVMPQIQQLSRDFATEQKAKREAAAAAPAAPAPAPAPTATPKP